VKTVCQTLSSAGASVIVADIRPDIAEEVALDIQASGKRSDGSATRCQQRRTKQPLSKVAAQYGPDV